MNDVIFIGNRDAAARLRAAGITAYSPGPEQLAERVIAERARCRVLAMHQSTFLALPDNLARELREGAWPRLTLLPELGTKADLGGVSQKLKRQAAQTRANAP
jgi:vacuolar-type H+-ATPase subunit F/Vma7